MQQTARGTPVNEQIHEFHLAAERLAAKAKELTDKADTLKALTAAYPDLRLEDACVLYPRVGTPISPAANRLATNVELTWRIFSATPGVPPGTIDARVFLIDPVSKLRIYADPAEFHVGRLTAHGAGHESPDWRKQMQEAGIPPALIEKTARELQAALQQGARYFQ